MPRALPSGSGARGHFRLRYDITDSRGAMTLRRAGRLYHLKVGAAFARRRVLAIIDEQEVTVVALDTGEILSAHVVEPDRGYWRNTRRDRLISERARLLAAAHVGKRTACSGRSGAHVQPTRLPCRCPTISNAARFRCWSEPQTRNDSDEPWAQQMTTLVAGMPPSRPVRQSIVAAIMTSRPPSGPAIAGPEIREPDERRRARGSRVLVTRNI